MERKSSYVPLEPVDYEHNLNETTMAARQKRYEFLKRFIDPGDCILDIGTNSAVNLRDLASCANLVVGVDIDCLFTRYAAANVRGYQNVHMLQMDAQNLALSPRTFDVISSFECLEHIGDPHKALVEMLRVAKPDAIFVFSTPNKDTIAGDRPLSSDHLREWTHKEFESLLSQCFVDVDWYGQRFAEVGARRNLYGQVRSSWIYGIYTSMPSKVRSIMSNILLKVSFGGNWDVEPYGSSSQRAPLIAIAVCRNPKTGK